MTYKLPHLRSDSEKQELLFGKRNAKILAGEPVKERKKSIFKEASEQSTIAGYIKKHYPDLPFETVKHEGKKQFWEQSQHKKQNSDDSFPDTRIYFDHCTLMIENKRFGTKLTLKDGRMASDHLQYQYNTHKRLFKGTTYVYFAVGVSEAIELFERVRNGNIPPQQLFKNRW